MPMLTSSIALLNNFFGRQFNSLNDVNIHPENKDIYFTDTIYGYVQDFRPAPGLPNQIYRFNPDTGAVTIAADGFVHSNGMAITQYRCLVIYLTTSRFHLFPRWQACLCHGHRY